MTGQRSLVSDVLQLNSTFVSIWRKQIIIKGVFNCESGREISILHRLFLSAKVKYMAPMHDDTA